MPRQCNPNENNIESKICNPLTGRWIKQSSRLGKQLMKEIKSKQPKIIKVRIGKKTRQMLRIGHNQYALVPLIQPKKLFDLKNTKNKSYCGKNKNIYDLTNYSNANNQKNPYGYSGIDSRYSCLNKGIYLGDKIDAIKKT